MKKSFLLVVLIILIGSNYAAYAQWVQKLALPASETIQFISPVSDQTVWAITFSRRVYVTVDSGKTWRKRTATGFANDDFFEQLLALDSKVAFLTANTGFTGTGPGIVYKTTDGGRNWHQVFTHSGNCDFHLGMSTNKKGLLVVNYNNFSASSRQSLFATKDGGNTWDSTLVTDPSSFYTISSFFLKGNQVWFDANDTLFHSVDFAQTWTAEELPPGVDFNHMFFESNDYAIANASALIDVYLKTPASPGWIHIGDPTGKGGALIWLLLDGNTGAFAIPLDDQKNFFSTDSCQTFNGTLVDPSDAFFDLQQARHGESLWGFTSFSKKIYANFRTQPLKISKPSADGFSMNVYNNILTIHSTENPAASFVIHVYDLMGREMRSLKMAREDEENLSALASGLYIGTVESNGFRKSLRFEIIH